MNLRFTSVKLILGLAPASEPSFTAAFSLKERSKTSSNELMETHAETNDSKQFVRDARRNSEDCPPECELEWPASFFCHRDRF